MKVQKSIRKKLALSRRHYANTPGLSKGSSRLLSLEKPVLIGWKKAQYPYGPYIQENFSVIDIRSYDMGAMALKGHAFREW